MNHRPFRELVEKMPAAAQKRVRARTVRLLAQMELGELREALKVRQEEMSQRLEISQAAVSRLERRSNLKLSSLAEYIRALGGSLELRAVLPGRTVTLTNLVGAKLKSERRKRGSGVPR